MKSISMNPVKWMTLAVLSLPLMAMVSPAHARLQALACEPEWAALLTELAGDRVEITVATSPTQDPHQVQARPALISAARRADLLVCTGAGLEAGWLPLLLGKSTNQRIQSPPGLFLAAERVALLDVPDSLDRSQGDVHGAGNPHIHLDPRRMLDIATRLTDTLEQLDPDGSSDYRARLATLQHRWQGMMDELQSAAAPLAGTEVVVHHNSFRYLEDWLQLRSIATLEPKPGIPPSPGHLASLASQVQGSDARLILYTDFNGDKAARWLARETGRCPLKLPFTVGTDTDTLPALYRQLVDKLLAAQQACVHE